MKNQQGSAVMLAIMTALICGLILGQTYKQILLLTQKTNNSINSEQIFLSSVDTANIFADEIINNTQLGNKILNALSSQNSFTLENIVSQTNCINNIKIEKPYQNKIEISAQSTKNNKTYKIKLELTLNETVSPAIWTINNYRKES